MVSRFPLAYAKIVKDRKDGTYDIVYKREGYEEARVPRSRLRPAKEPPWQLVWRGFELKTSVEDLVPDYIREREPGFEVLCCFTLQTIGVDFPFGERSLMGDVAVCFTRNPTPQEKIDPRKRFRRVIEIDSLVLYCWNNMYWGDGVGKYFS